MTLRHRLRRLQLASGNSTSDRAALAERIQRLRPGREKPGWIDPMAERTLATRLHGRLVTNGLIQIEERIVLSGVHGRVSLAMLRQIWDALPDSGPLDPDRLVFLDTETTGLAGGSGTLVFLLGLARIQAQALVVRQFLLSRIAAETALFEAASDWIGPDATLITYNGRTFDLPLLTTRCRLTGQSDVFSSLPHLDLLCMVRRAFAKQWNDCRLSTSEQMLLGFRRRDDLPGAQAPRAWLDWIRWREGARLPEVCRHNRWDLLSLAMLLPVLSRVFRQPAAYGADVLAMARGDLRSGRFAQGLDLLERHRDRLDAAGRLELARLYRRTGRWHEARALWTPLAQQGNAEAREQLAKYDEHVLGDHERAFAHAEKLPSGPDRERRLQRLQRKMGGN